jgi:hypothetical protein
MKANWFAAALLAASSLATPAQANVDPVVYWNQVLTTNVTGSPVLTSRTYSMVDVAIFEAVNATTGNTRQSYLGLSATPGDTSAAVARAARDVMLSVLPASAVTQRADVEAKYQAAINAIPDSAAKTAGLNTGAQAATTVINSRATDGFNAVSTYATTNQPGHWQPTSPGATPVTPQWGGVTPWGLTSGSQFRPGPPPAWDSPEFAAALAEVQAIGAANSATRTAFQTQSALYWASAAGTGLTPWINGAINAASGQGLTSLDYAAMFAALTTNVADATIGIFDAKYTYDFWRPSTASLYFDPNSTYTALLSTTPSHPSYISGHSGVAAAAAATLSHYLGLNTGICFAGFTCFNSFGLAAQNGADSRLWGGIHYSFDNQAGLALGNQVAQFNLNRGLFQPVPEPGTWSMMLIGFGLIGLSIRRRRKGIAQLA